jgi:hypothetical protein
MVKLWGGEKKIMSPSLLDNSKRLAAAFRDPFKHTRDFLSFVQLFTVPRSTTEEDFDS